MAKTEILQWTLDMEKGAKSYDESLASVLGKVVQTEINEAAAQKRKFDPKKSDPRVRLEASVRAMSSIVNEMVNEIDLREACMVFGTVIGSEFGQFLAQKQATIEQLVDLLETFAFAATDTAERISKQIQ